MAGINCQRIVDNPTFRHKEQIIRAAMANTPWLRLAHPSDLHILLYWPPQGTFQPNPSTINDT